MATVKKNRPVSIAVTLFNSTDGSPLTGVVAGDVTMYFRRPDLSTPVEKDITTSNFRELDATNMPGVYEVDFTSEDTNREGEFVVTIQANGGINLEQKNFAFEVVSEDAEPDDLNNTSVSILDQSSSPTVMVELRDGDGNQVEGITQDYVEPTFFKNGTEDTTNTTFSAWSEVDDVFYPGLYSVQLPTGATDTLGDLVMRIQKNWDYAATTLTNSFDDGTSADSFDDGTNKLALFGTDNGLLYQNTTFTETDPGSWSSDGAWAAAAGVTEPQDIDIAWDSGNSDFIKAVSTPNGSLWVYKNGAWTEYDTGVNVRLTHPVIFGPNLITVNSNEDDEIFKWDGATISSYYTAASADAWFVGAKVDSDTTDELWLGNTNGLFRIQDVTVAASLEDISSRLAGHTTEAVNDIQQKPTSGDVGVVANSVFWYSTDSGTSFVQRDLPIVRNSFAGELDPENDTSMGSITYDAYDSNEPFIVGAAFDLLINREVSGSDGTDWNQVTFEGQGYGTASNLGFVPHRFIAGSVDTVDEDNFEAGIWNYRDIPFFYPPFLRFSVRNDFSNTASDLTNILTDLSEIKGDSFLEATDALDNLYAELSNIQGSGFTTSGDSLADISADVTANSGSLTNVSSELTTIQNSISAIKGSNFDAAIHSLSGSYQETPYVGDLEQNTSATVTVKVGERTGISAEDLEADLVKEGTVATTTLLSSWQEIDATNLPGVYRFTLSNTDTDTLGDLLVRIEQVVGVSTEFLGVQFLSPSSGDVTFQGDAVDVTAFATDGMALITNGNGGVARDVVFTTDGGSTWDNVGFLGTGTPGRRIDHRPGSPPNVAILYGDLTLATAQLTAFDDFTDVTLSSTIKAHPFTNGVVPGSGLSMVDDGSDFDVIWMATGDGESNSPPTGHVVRYDDNAGSDSIVRDGTGVGPNGQVYMDVYAIDDQTALILAAEWQTPDTSTAYPRIYKTTDAGSSWTTVYSDSVVTIPAQIEFDSTGQYGFASAITDPITGDLGLFKTTDGGDNWTAISPTLDGSVIDSRSAHRGLHVIDQDNVIIGLTTGSDGSDLDLEFYLLRSKDGGQTFTKVDVSDDISSGVLYGIDGFSNQTFGAVAASSPASQDIVQYGHNPFPDALKDLSYKFRVVGDASVDLTPVTNSLDDIKGTGFDTNTDSLEQLKDNQEAIKGTGFDTNTDSLEQIKDASGSTDLSPVTNALDDIKGTGFDTNTDSLEQIRDAAGTTDLTPVTDVLDEIKGGAFNPASDSLDQIRDTLDNQTGTLDSVDTVVTEIQSSVARVLGLSQENVRITNQTYDADNNLTGSVISVYGSASDVQNQTNPLATYSLTADYDSQNRLIDYRIERTS